MKCFLSVVKHIAAAAVTVIIVAIALGLIAAATIATAWVFGVTGGLVVAIMLLYFVVAIGTLAGLAECWG